MRGRELGMIFQEPLTRLNPLMRISRALRGDAQAPRAGSDRKDEIRDARRWRCCG